MKVAIVIVDDSQSSTHTFVDLTPEQAHLCVMAVRAAIGAFACALAEGLQEQMAAENAELTELERLWKL